jgi:hypothetical protein
MIGPSRSSIAIVSGESRTANQERYLADAENAYVVGGSHVVLESDADQTDSPNTFEFRSNGAVYINGTLLANSSGTLYYRGQDTDSRYVNTTDSYVDTDLVGRETEKDYPRLVANNSGASTPGWIRVGNSGGQGLIPYANGVGNLGTSSWRFSQIHGVTIYENGEKLADKYEPKGTLHDDRYVNKAGDSIVGSLTVTNPANSAASISLSWLNGNPRLRIGGSGDGAAGSFTIQGTGDLVRFTVDANGHVTTKGNLTVGGSLNMATDPIQNVSALTFAKDSYMSANKGLNMNNSDIYGVNNIVINDAGAGEGIEWAGGNGWKIVEAPDSLTNAAGNLQLMQGSSRRLTIRTDGDVDVAHNLLIGSDRSGQGTQGFIKWMADSPQSVQLRYNTYDGEKAPFGIQLERGTENTQTTYEPYIATKGWFVQNGPGGGGLWSGWNGVFEIDNGSHGVIWNRAGGIGFGLHSNGTFYWIKNITGTGSYMMELQPDGDLLLRGGYVPTVRSSTAGPSGSARTGDIWVQY